MHAINLTQLLLLGQQFFLCWNLLHLQLSVDHLSISLKLILSKISGLCHGALLTCLMMLMTKWVLSTPYSKRSLKSMLQSSLFEWRRILPHGYQNQSGMRWTNETDSSNSTGEIHPLFCGLSSRRKETVWSFYRGKPKRSTSFTSFPPRPIPPPCGNHLNKLAERTKWIAGLPSSPTISPSPMRWTTTLSQSVPRPHLQTLLWPLLLTLL